jgi:hypothetical protein
MLKPLLSTIVAALTLAVGAAHAQAPRGLLFTEEGHPLSLLPQRGPDLPISSFSIGRSAFSPDGRHWAISAVTAASSKTASGVAVISGTTAGLTQYVLANATLPGLNLAFSSTPTSIAAANSGDIAFGTQVVGGSAFDRVMVARYRAATGQYEIAARQNDVIPGLGSVLPGATGERYGSVLTTASFLGDNRLAVMAENTSGPLPTTLDELLLVEGNPVRVVAQVGVTTPTNQSGGTASSMGNLDRRAFVSPDGVNWLVTGQLNKSPNPDVVVVNNRVVLEEGMPVAGLAGNVVTPVAQLWPGGRWTARGRSTGGQAYLIVDGVLRVVSGASPRGLPEIGLVSTIDSAALNARGDLVYSVRTTIGPWWIVVEPADGSRPYVGVGPWTALDVGGSARGAIYYSGQYSVDLPLFATDEVIYFVTRARDSLERTVGDGLFVMPFPRPPVDPVPVE